MEGMNLEDFITKSQVARILGRDAQVVRYYARMQRLRTITLSNGTKLFYKPEVLAFAAERECKKRAQKSKESTKGN